jgi:hypothetical protein
MYPSTAASDTGQPPDDLLVGLHIFQKLLQVARGVVMFAKPNASFIEIFSGSAFFQTQSLLQGNNLGLGVAFGARAAGVLWDCV